MLCGEVGDCEVSKLDQTKVAHTVLDSMFLQFCSRTIGPPFANCLFFDEPMWSLSLFDSFPLVL